MKKPSITAILNKLVIVALLSGVSYCTYNFASAKKRVKALCDQITPGMSVAQLSEFSRKHGLTLPRSDSGITYITESKTFGRFACEIQLSNGIVVDAQYNFAD